MAEPRPSPRGALPLAATGLGAIATAPVHLHETLESTNAEARRRAEAGEAGPVWVHAERQTAGRGRRGRVWTDHPGNLKATLLLRPSWPARTAALASFAAALALADLLRKDVPPEAIRLKWPNDVLVRGRKIAGILLEAEGGSGAGADGQVAWLAIGIGLNLAAHPDGTETPATHWAEETGRAAPDPASVLTHLAGHLDRWLTCLDRDGFKPLRDTWLAQAAGLGEPITVRLEGQTVEGWFDTLDPDGCLIVKQADGTARRVASGDVFFPWADQDLGPGERRL